MGDRYAADQARHADAVLWHSGGDSSGRSVSIRSQRQGRRHRSGRKIDVIEVFPPENLDTRALQLKLVEPQGRFVFGTRLRLAGSPDVWVVVTFTDGGWRGASAPTVVTSYVLSWARCADWLVVPAEPHRSGS